MLVPGTVMQSFGLGASLEMKELTQLKRKEPWIRLALHKIFIKMTVKLCETN